MYVNGHITNSKVPEQYSIKCTPSIPAHKWVFHIWEGGVQGTCAPFETPFTHRQVACLPPPPEEVEKHTLCLPSPCWKIFQKKACTHLRKKCQLQYIYRPQLRVKEKNHHLLFHGRSSKKAQWGVRESKRRNNCYYPAWNTLYMLVHM